MADYTESSGDELYDADADATQVMEVDTDQQDVEEYTPGQIKETPFSVPYRSRFILMEPNNNERMAKVLRHAPCSYTCTAGIAPSLLELKQHAHDLIAMIKGLTVSTMPGVIDGLNAANEAESNDKVEVPTFEDGETFDFLNDLTEPYKGPREGHPHGPALAHAHQQPLTALLNVLEEKNIPKSGEARPPQRIRNICPLHRVADLKQLPPTGQSLPYAQHQALIQHANEILELLDHEYSAKGGLLSILPPKDQNEDREKAEATLLGQMILYTQRLVQRLHDLERLYANAMDVMAGEAIVPHQALSRLGPDGRSGCEMVYPQDRFVLVNAGEDVWSHLSNEFDKKDRVDEIVMDSYRKLGATGEQIWQQRGGQEMNRGITAIDVTTRYYRLRGTEVDAPKTIFVIPAWNHHPGTQATRDMERTPSVVSVVKPVWPERASLWEQKHRGDLDDLKKYRAMAQNMHEENRRKTQEITALRSQYELRAGELRKEKEETKRLNKILEEPGNREKKLQIEATNRAREAEEKTRVVLRDAQSLKDKNLRESEEIQQEGRKGEARRNELMAQLRQSQQEQNEKYHQKMAELEAKDVQMGENNLTLAHKLRAAWQTQIIETQTLIEQMKSGDKPHDAPMGPTAALGRKNGEIRFNKIIAAAVSSPAPPRQQPAPGFTPIQSITTAKKPPSKNFQGFGYTIKNDDTGMYTSDGGMYTSDSPMSQ